MVAPHVHQVDLDKIPAVGKICGREQHGRLSLKGLITVPTKDRQDLGIPLDATEFVFAYPLRTSMLAKVIGICLAAVYRVVLISCAYWTGSQV